MAVLEAPPAVSPASPAPPRWELYRLLAEPVRLKLLALAAEEELSVGELAELLGESQPNVSRHAAALRQSALLRDRREGTRTLLRVAGDAAADAVVADALASGRALCEQDGALARIADVVRAREAAAREFFARPHPARGKSAAEAPPPEIGAYLASLAPLLARRLRAVDAHPRDHRHLDALAHDDERVVRHDHPGEPCA